MGIRDELQTEIAAAFDGDLADAVNAFTGSYVIRTGWDPVTETGGETTVIYTGRGVLSKYSLNRIDGVNILHGDLKLTALVCEVTDKPAIGHIIEIYDPVSRQLQRYEVITASVDPSASVYSIKLRRA
ncbi:glutamate 5-kinase [Salmonella enterica subsp. enterica serovar Brandenburg]|nr:glutamate 5-kinase [Salmonella enterica subsp. enterica serovar Johannesburg]EDI0784773.1 glutamate 5-kinase [Salmonella enterica subsp. enterica serovar Kasenyi]EDT6458687.1 glutamate 5-kinase [Salmonella enterica subsp. enterica]EEE3274504.1 glutamate 5-kinase [Salmonella enterica subsp. enterica serovar Braenderup]EIC3510626.1 glutamate 5-kinase [Salmonella enterica subsp. enterica serovar Oranienburg]